MEKHSLSVDNQCLSNRKAEFFDKLCFSIEKQNVSKNYGFFFVINDVDRLKNYVFRFNNNKKKTNKQKQNKTKQNKKKQNKTKKQTKTKTKKQKKKNKKKQKQKTCVFGNSSFHPINCVFLGKLCFSVFFDRKNKNYQR